MGDYTPWIGREGDNLILAAQAENGRQVMAAKAAPKP
jgi:hypothetical protein